MRISPSWRIKSIGTILLVSALSNEVRPSASPMRTKDIAPTSSLPPDLSAKVSRPQELLRRSSFGLLAGLGKQATERRPSFDRKTDAAGLGFGLQQAILQFRALNIASANDVGYSPTEIRPADPNVSACNLDDMSSSPPTVPEDSTSISGIFLSNLQSAAFSSLQHAWRTADTLHLSSSQGRDTQDALANLHLWASELVGERLDTAIAGDDQIAMLVADSLRRINTLLGSEIENSGDEEENNDPYEAAYYETKLLLQLMPAIEQRLAFLEGHYA
jgi:hypothetical protein